MAVVWIDEKHKQNIPVIDIQHKELFVLINKLSDGIAAAKRLEGQWQRELLSTLKSLYNYTRFHFITEEELFYEFNYPDADKHISEHNRFKEIVKNYLKDFKEDNNLSLEYLQDFLVEWILSHIQEVDHKYTVFFSSKNITPLIQYSEKDSYRNSELSIWEQKKLQLEIRTIDKQHKELVAILQQTNDLQHTSNERKEIFLPLIIKKLLSYSQYHFSCEEELMAKHNFPNLENHREQHKLFVQDIIKIDKDYQSSKTELTDVILFYLRDWIVVHILNEDKKYIKFIPS